MTVDRDARNRLAELLRHFVAKQTTNFEFDDAAFDIKTDDAGPMRCEIRLGCCMTT